MGGLIASFKNQITFKPQPLPLNTRLDNQTAIVTGANTGIGLETARQLASHGVAHLILGVRDTAKGDTAKADILKSNQNCTCNIEV
jgi:NAD(P)-dependent dehydrogenase (short-subunit alcohol dehydrogenase family)